MAKKKFSPAPLIILKDLDVLKTLADPLRNQIMEILTPEPLTVNQISDKLGVTASKLYYHINMMEKHGLITVVDTVIHGNLIEKYYWITAYEFDLDKDICNFGVDTSEGKDKLISLLLANIETTRDDLRRSLEARHFQIQQGAEKKPRHVFNYRQVLNIPDERAEEFYQRLHDVVQEFKDIPEDKERVTQPWALSIMMYPSFYYSQLDAGEEQSE